MWGKAVFSINSWVYMEKDDTHVQKELYFGRGERKNLYTSNYVCDT